MTSCRIGNISAKEDQRWSAGRRTIMLRNKSSIAVIEWLCFISLIKRVILFCGVFSFNGDVPHFKCSPYKSILTNQYLQINTYYWTNHILTAKADEEQTQRFVDCGCAVFCSRDTEETRQCIYRVSVEEYVRPAFYKVKIERD